MGDIGGFGSKSASKSAQKGSKKQRVAIESWLLPEEFLRRYNVILGGLGDAGEPTRARLTDAAALGEQTQMQGLDADAARRGLAGSGFHLAGRQAVRGSRQARVNDALRQLYEKRMQLAAQTALGTQQSTAAGIGGVPVVGTPSSGAVAADTATDLLSLYLAFGGGGGGK